MQLHPFVTMVGLSTLVTQHIDCDECTRDAKCSTCSTSSLSLPYHACFCACSVPPSRLPSILLLHGGPSPTVQPEQAAHAHQQQGKHRPVCQQVAVCSPWPINSNCSSSNCSSSSSSSSRHSMMVRTTQTSQCGASEGALQCTCLHCLMHGVGLHQCWYGASMRSSSLMPHTSAGDIQDACLSIVAWSVIKHTLQQVAM
jgi:hypothetical protein